MAMLSADPAILREMASRIEALCADVPGSGNSRDAFLAQYHQQVTAIYQFPMQIGNSPIFEAGIWCTDRWVAMIMQYHFDGYCELAKALRSIADQMDAINAN